MIAYPGTYRGLILRKLYGLTLIAAFLFGWGIAAAVYPQMTAPHTPLPAYVYTRLTSPNGVVLSVIRTSADNITLKAIANNVTKTGDYGINGGFFYQGYLLSIAVSGDKPARGNPKDYGSGWYNIDRKKGTLVWDEVSHRFSVQIAESAEDLRVIDRSRYWAQGGVSMSLQNDDGWQEKALAEDMPAFDNPRLRSAAVYDQSQNLWLVVSESRSTVEQFRTAIRDTIGEGKLVDGVFLDGDGSSQLLTAEAALRGDSRQVYQMMALKRTGL